jgi:HEAT repeat protein
MSHRSLKSLALIALILSVFTASVVPQQREKTKNNDNIHQTYVSGRQFTEREIDNLKIALRSENTGLRKSAIYLTGFYGMREMVPVLVDQLKREESADVKILTALVLLKIEDPRGIRAIEELSIRDDNARVRRMSKAILNEFKNKTVVTEVSER